MRNGGYCVFVDSLGCGGVVRNRKGPCHFFEVLGIPLSQRTFLGKGGLVQQMIMMWAQC